VIGSDRVALLGSFDRLRYVQPEVITPRVLVMSDGKGEGNSNTILTTYLATLLSGESARPLTPYQRPQEKPYVSKLMEGDDDGSQSPASQPMTATPAPTSTEIVATSPAQMAPAKPGVPQKNDKPSQ
jgi:hypothetical protein